MKELLLKAKVVSRVDLGGDTNLLLESVDGSAQFWIPESRLKAFLAPVETKVVSAPEEVKEVKGGKRVPKR